VRKETSTRVHVHAVDSKYDTTTQLRSVFDLNAYSNRIALSRNVLRRAEKRKLLEKEREREREREKERESSSATATQTRP